MLEGTRQRLLSNFNSSADDMGRWKHRRLQKKKKKWLHGNETASGIVSCQNGVLHHNIYSYVQCEICRQDPSLNVYKWEKQTARRENCTMHYSCAITFIAMQKKATQVVFEANMQIAFQSRVLLCNQMACWSWKSILFICFLLIPLSRFFVLDISYNTPNLNSAFRRVSTVN